MTSDGPGCRKALTGRRESWTLAGCLLLAAWVHRHALSVFFTSPDDLIHLQQAAGLIPTLPTPFRILSQVLYFRLMLRIFGPHPIPFHLVTMLLHLINIALVFRLARGLGIRHRTAALGAVLFGAFPLFSTLLSSAVGVNDELAFALALAALLTLGLKGVPGVVLPIVLFGLGMLCKESVICLPLLALVPPFGAWTRSGLRRAAPLLGVALLFAALFAALRPRGLAPDAIVYAVGVGPNVFHNLMTYFSWSANLRNPLPDLVSSPDPRAWRVGAWVALGSLASLMTLGKREPAIRLGAAWFVLGLLPVLPLQYQTYRHYLYPALPGLTLVVAGTVLGGFERLMRFSRWPDPTVSRLAGGLAILCGLAYGTTAERLVRERFDARIPGTDLALDPVSRRREVAERALASLGSYLRHEHVRVAILVPEGLGRVFGARSGKEYGSLPRGFHPYNLLQESIDQGRAVRLFYPGVDTVAFVAHWTRAQDDYDLFLPCQDGSLIGVGQGPAAHREVAAWMMEQHGYPQARDHLKSALDVYSGDPTLRLGYGVALLKTGDREAAIAQLKQVIRIAPADSAALAAKVILARLEARTGIGP
jgi:hypothetical protein